MLVEMDRRTNTKAQGSLFNVVLPTTAGPELLLTLFPFKTPMLSVCTTALESDMCEGRKNAHDCGRSGTYSREFDGALQGLEKPSPQGFSLRNNATPLGLGRGMLVVGVVALRV